MRKRTIRMLDVPRHERLAYATIGQSATQVILRRPAEPEVDHGPASRACHRQVAGSRLRMFPTASAQAAPAADESQLVQEILRLANAAKNAIESTPPPQAPPLPYRYNGSGMWLGKPIVFLQRGDKSFMVSAGDTLEVERAALSRENDRRAKDRMPVVER